MYLAALKLYVPKPADPRDRYARFWVASCRRSTGPVLDLATLPPMCIVRGLSCILRWCTSIHRLARVACCAFTSV